jgi:alpha,alpha-trehalose phosphorylase
MGFGGLRDHGGRLAFAPRLPGHLPRLSFRLRWRDSSLRVTITPAEATYEVSGPPVELTHHGESLTVGAAPVTRALPRTADRTAPSSPRPPERRRDALES